MLTINKIHQAQTVKDCPQSPDLIHIEKVFRMWWSTSSKKELHTLNFIEPPLAFITLCIVVALFKQRYATSQHLFSSRVALFLAWILYWQWESQATLVGSSKSSRHSVELSSRLVINSYMKMIPRANWIPISQIEPDEFCYCHAGMCTFVRPLTVWVKIIIAKHRTSWKHKNHCNNHPNLDSLVFSYLNPNGDFFWPGSVHLNESTFRVCKQCALKMS